MVDDPWAKRVREYVRRLRHAASQAGKTELVIVIADVLTAEDGLNIEIGQQDRAAETRVGTILAKRRNQEKAAHRWPADLGFGAAGVAAAGAAARTVGFCEVMPRHLSGWSAFWPSTAAQIGFELRRLPPHGRERESHPVITMVQSSPTRRPVVIVDDHPLVRRGLKAVIDAEPDLIVCGEAATREDGLRAIAAVRPDLVVVELSLVRGDGLELIREIRSRY